MRGPRLAWAVLQLALLLLASASPLARPAAASAPPAHGRAARTSGSLRAWTPMEEGLNESVGINDNGSAPLSNGLVYYGYATSALMGYFAFYGGSFYSGPPINATEFSVQLNSNFNVTANMTLWAQDTFSVAYENGVYEVSVIDNLWNSTLLWSNVSPSLVEGNGNFSTWLGETYYYYVAPTTYVTSPPFYLYAYMRVSLSGGYPQVYMYYRFENSTYDSGWVLYDVITVLVKSSNPEFLTGVINGGTQSSPFVTQWVVAGAGSGSQLDVYGWSASMALYYYYHGTWFSVPDAVALQPQYYSGDATAENVNQYYGILESYDSVTGLVTQSQGESVQEFLWRPALSYTRSGDDLTLYLTPPDGEWLISVSGSGYSSEMLVNHSPVLLKLGSGSYLVKAILYAGSQPVDGFVVYITNRTPSPEPISSCTNITAPGTYYLSSFLGGTQNYTDYCVGVFANNVTIEGEGLQVIGDGFGDGIYVNGTNVNVSGVVVKDYFKGFSVWSSDDVLYNNTLEDNYEGIGLYGNGKSVVYNYIYNNTFGIYLMSSYGDYIAGNRFIGDGLYVSTTHEGYGNVVVDNTVNGRPLVYLENESNLVVRGAGQVIAINSYDLTIEDSNLSHTTVGVELLGVNDSMVEGCTISDNSQDGVIAIGNYNLIYGNVITDNEGPGGIYVAGNGTEVYNNVVTGNLNDGIDVTGGPFWLLGYNVINSGYGDSIAYNNVTGNLNDGIDVFFSNDVTIHNDIVSSNFDGIYLEFDSYINITDNLIIGNNLYGVDLENSYGTTMVGNRFIGDGLYVYDSYGNVVIKDAVNGRPLVYLENVSGAVVRGAGQVVAVNSKDVLVEDSNLSYASIGVEFLNVSNSTVEDNVVVGNSEIGVDVIGYGDVIRNNTVADNGNCGIYVFGNRSSVVDNYVTSNNYGVRVGYSLLYSPYFAPSLNDTVTGNVLTNSSTAGLYLLYSYGDLIYNNVFNNTRNVYMNDSWAYWNVALRPGKNVVGGDMIGGNAWLFPNGTGPSQVCMPMPQDPYVCSEPYGLGGNNTDYLPLVYPRLLNVSSPVPFYVNGTEYPAGSHVISFFPPANVTFPVAYYVTNTSRLVLERLVVNNEPLSSGSSEVYLTSTVGAIYLSQFYVTLPFTVSGLVNGTSESVSSGWYSSGTRIVVFPQVVYQGLTRYVIYSAAMYEVAGPLEVSPPYYAQYYVEVAEPVPANVNGVNTTLGSGWYNASTRIVIFRYYYVNSTARELISSNVSSLALGSPVVISASATYQYYVVVKLPNGTTSGWYDRGSVIELPAEVYVNGTEYALQGNSTVVVSSPLTLTPKYVPVTTTTTTTTAVTTTTTTATTFTTASTTATTTSVTSATSTTTSTSTTPTSTSSTSSTYTSAPTSTSPATTTVTVTSGAQAPSSVNLLAIAIMVLAIAIVAAAVILTVARRR